MLSVNPDFSCGSVNDLCQRFIDHIGVPALADKAGPESV